MSVSPSDWINTLKIMKLKTTRSRDRTILYITFAKIKTLGFKSVYKNNCLSEFSFKKDLEMAFVKENKIMIQNKAFQIFDSEMEVNEREHTKMVETIYKTIELRKCFCFISKFISCFNK